MNHLPAIVLGLDVHKNIESQTDTDSFSYALLFFLFLFQKFSHCRSDDSSDGDDSNTELLNTATSIFAPTSHNCTTCGRSYQSAYTLKRHLRSECNKPKGFICRYCGRGFHHNFKLVEHFRRLHGKKPDHENVSTPSPRKATKKSKRNRS